MMTLNAELSDLELAAKLEAASLDEPPIAVDKVKNKSKSSFSIPRVRRNDPLKKKKKSIVKAIKLPSTLRITRTSIPIMWKTNQLQKEIRTRSRTVKMDGKSIVVTVKNHKVVTPRSLKSHTPASSKSSPVSSKQSSTTSTKSLKSSGNTLTSRLRQYR